jgi:hypothetical protein
VKLLTLRLISVSNTPRQRVGRPYLHKYWSQFMGIDPMLEEIEVSLFFSVSDLLKSNK